MNSLKEKHRKVLDQKIITLTSIFIYIYIIYLYLNMINQYKNSSRKTSGQDSFSNHEDNRSNRSDSLVAGNKTRNDVFKQNKKDEGNSTNSSPSLRSSNS